MRIFSLLSLAVVIGAGCWAVAHPLLFPTPPPSSTYVNPVIDRNFPDPALFNSHGVFYGYATNSGANIPCARSRDLVHWTMLPDAMPILPLWAKSGHTWAPFVSLRAAGGGYVVYFTARNRATGRESIGAALSTRPEGPFVSAPDAAPLVEQTEDGGAIDPTCFTEQDGARYLLWKNDGNSRGRDTWLWLQTLSADGLSLTGTPTRLIKQDQPWEGTLVEAPTLWKHSGKYYLFYSANAYGTCRYAVGYAVADTLRGPYRKPRSQPWLSSTPQMCGPGGEAIVRADSGLCWMAYHTWAHGPHTYRAMSINPLVWDSDGPYLLGITNNMSPAEAQVHAH